MMMQNDDTPNVLFTMKSAITAPEKPDALSAPSSASWVGDIPVSIRLASVELVKKKLIYATVTYRHSTSSMIPTQIFVLLLVTLFLMRVFSLEKKFSFFSPSTGSFLLVMLK
jgi:hypothetical protein